MINSGSQNYSLARLGLLTMFLFSSVLVVVVLLRYPADAQHTSYGIAWVLMLLGTAAATLGRSWPVKGHETANIRSFGIVAGLVFGILWVLEITFNHLPPDIATPTTTFIVDNTAWGIIAVSMIAISGISAWKYKRLTAGISTGFWSGLTSGLMACFTGLVLILFFITLIVGEPTSNEEYILRGSTSGISNIYSYFAYETLTGALMHFIILGMLMGAVMGCIGSLIAAGLKRLQK